MKNTHVVVSEYGGPEKLRLIEELHRLHVRQKKNDLAPARDLDSLPPDTWLNEQLMQLGETWRVQTVDGFRYEFYDAPSSR